MVNQSLQAQLLKAGLTDKKKADALRKEQKKGKRKKGKKAQSADVEHSKAEAAREAQEKTERDRALNAQQQATQKARADHARVKQLIDTNLYSSDSTEEQPYHFKDETTIHKLYLPSSTINALSGGSARIVKWESKYCVIHLNAAERIAQVMPEILINTQEEKEAPKNNKEVHDYSEYQIPDDLMW